eukprot:6183476-Pleurochrysis_carterae.AAC.7
MYHVKTFIEKVDADGVKASKTVVRVAAFVMNKLSKLCFDLPPFPHEIPDTPRDDLRGSAPSDAFGSRRSGQGQRGRGRGSMGNARGRGGVGSRGAGGSADQAGVSSSTTPAGSADEETQPSQTRPQRRRSVPRLTSRRGCVNTESGSQESSSTETDSSDEAEEPSKGVLNDAAVTSDQAASATASAEEALSATIASPNRPLLPLPPPNRPLLLLAVLMRMTPAPIPIRNRRAEWEPGMEVVAGLSIMIWTALSRRGGERWHQADIVCQLPEPLRRRHSFTHDAVFGHERHWRGIALSAESYDDGCWVLLQKRSAD